MPTTDCATVVADSQSDAPQSECLQPTPDETSKHLRSLFVGFAVTVTVGLALASWYVGVRIVAADEVAPTRTPATAESATALSATPTAAPQLASTIPAPSTEENSMAEAYWYMVPPPVDLYLQVAGLDPKQDARFVRSLKAKGFHAQVQTLNEDDERILIGPFSSHAAMERAQDKLHSAGVLAIEAAY